MRESFVKLHEEIAFRSSAESMSIILWRMPAGQLLFGAALFAQAYNSLPSLMRHPEETTHVR